jgi:hypothetical protein
MLMGVEVIVVLVEAGIAPDPLVYALLPAVRAGQGEATRGRDAMSSTARSAGDKSGLRARFKIANGTAAVSADETGFFEIR